MESQSYLGIEAPTALGKSYTVATTPWSSLDRDTGGNPVVHLHQTREARDQAYTASCDAGCNAVRLRSGHKACGLASGHYDDDYSLDGKPLSDWFDCLCNRRGVPFSVAHRQAVQRLDGLLEHEDCPYSNQFNRLRTDDSIDIVHATHHFAHVGWLCHDANVVLDEMPTYSVSPQRVNVEELVDEYLKAVTVIANERPVNSYDELVQTARLGVAIEFTESTPPDDWYLSTAAAHVHARAFVEAIASMKQQSRENDRWVGQAVSIPETRPSFVDSGDATMIRVVVQSDGTVRSVREIPSLFIARSVICLDAYPSYLRWRLNTNIDFDWNSLLTIPERTAWRRTERGLEVVQVGNGVYPFASNFGVDERLDSTALQNEFEAIRSIVGGAFRTCITTKAAKDETRALMHNGGISDPMLMHMGEEKSRNDFAGETVGYVSGSLDPGDGSILDWLAELRLDARPGIETCPKCGTDGCSFCEHQAGKRMRNRVFVGPDADEAEALLRSVREHHVVQALGRYARNPEDPDDYATVFVRTSAIPDFLVDERVDRLFDGFRPKRQEIATVACNAAPNPVTAPEVAAQVDACEQTVRNFLNEMADEGFVEANRLRGNQGATEYIARSLPPKGVNHVRSLL
jgi:hypothetical protein